MSWTARTRTRVGLFLLACALLVSVLFAFREPAFEVETVRAEVHPLHVTRRDQGITEIRQVYALHAPVAGVLERVTLEPGDTVKKDQVLLRLRPLHSSLRDARSLADVKSAVPVAEARVQEALAAMSAAQRDYQRVRDLVNQKFASDSALTGAQSALEQAQARVAAARASLAQARIQAATDSSDDGRTLLIRAPLDGVVLKRPLQSETPVAAGSLLLEIADPADLRVVAEFLSEDAVQFRIGAAARIEAWGGAPLDARVERIEPRADLKISALGVEERIVRVHLALETVPAGLGHGFRVDAVVVVEDLGEVLSLPLDALQRDGEGWRAFVVHDGRARLRRLETGAADDLRRAITGGLQPGETVVIRAPAGLQDGARVSAGAR